MRRHPAFLLVVLVVAALLAGCTAAGEEPPTPRSDDPEADAATDPAPTPPADDAAPLPVAEPAEPEVWHLQVRDNRTVLTLEPPDGNRASSSPEPYLPFVGWDTYRSPTYVAVGTTAGAPGGEARVSLTFWTWMPAKVTIRVWLEADGHVVGVGEAKEEAEGGPPPCVCLHRFEVPVPVGEIAAGSHLAVRYEAQGQTMGHGRGEGPDWGARLTMPQGP